MSLSVKLHLIVRRKGLSWNWKSAYSARLASGILLGSLMLGLQARATVLSFVSVDWGFKLRSSRLKRASSVIHCVTSPAHKLQLDLDIVGHTFNSRTLMEAEAGGCL